MRAVFKYHCRRGYLGCGYKFKQRKPVSRRDDAHCPSCGASRHTRKKTVVDGKVVWEPAIVVIEEPVAVVEQALAEDEVAAAVVAELEGGDGKP